MTDSPARTSPENAFALFRRRFWQPPRRHGEVIEDRTVSFLELFYDLVYVVLVGRAAHTLAHHVSWVGVADFVVVFGLLWIGWLNGTLYHEVHGREDGRSRTFIFVQMLVLAILAIYTGGAAGNDGRGFAATYTVLLVVLTWLWYTVRREDTEEFMAITGVYLIAMLLSIAVTGVSAFVDEDVRVLLWALIVVGWIVVGSSMAVFPGRTVPLGITVTDAMVERFGLFIIIVLGEVVVGVVDGLSAAERDFRTIATGALALAVGFGYWWTYFDFAGRRMPRAGRSGFPQWLYSHLPVTMSIAASGAAMVSLIEHAGDAHTPAGTAWLLSGAFALWLLSVVFTITALDDFGKYPDIYRPLTGVLAVGAGAALFVGWWQPVPWLIVLMLVLILAVIWFFAIDKLIRSGTGRGFLG